MYKFPKLSLNFIIALLFIINTTNGQWRIPTDSVYQLIKTNSIFKNNVKWESIDTKFEICIKSAKGNVEILKCFVKVFEALNDVHSSLIYKNQSYANYHVYNDDSIAWLTPLRNRSQLETNKIKTNLIKDKYAYIQVPGINAWGDQINTYAQAIADSVNKYNNPKIKGFIVDLRMNSGGQLASMLAGLHCLLGNSNIGAEIDENENVLRSWKIERGNFIQQGSQITNIIESSGQLNQLPVVVLISAVTMSSGSMAAIAFKSRTKTYFIGEPTANGYTTSLGWRPISKDLTLNLAEAYVKDRKGRIYPTYVPPDMHVKGGDHFDNLPQDFKVRAAIKWFEKNGYN